MLLESLVWNLASPSQLWTYSVICLQIWLLRKTNKLFGMLSRQKLLNTFYLPSSNGVIDCEQGCRCTTHQPSQVKTHLVSRFSSLTRGTSWSRQTLKKSGDAINSCLFCNLMSIYGSDAFLSLFLRKTPAAVYSSFFTLRRAIYLEARGSGLSLLSSLSSRTLWKMDNEDHSQDPRRTLNLSDCKKNHLSPCKCTSILTAGPEGPEGPVSPSFPDRPCSHRRIFCLIMQSWKKILGYIGEVERWQKW